MPRADGPDVSHYQHVTDPASVPPYRLFSCKLTEGATYKDPTAPGWVALMERLGVRHRGLYHWLRSDSSVEAQVLNAVNRLAELGLVANGRLRPGYMIQVDWERTLKNGVPIPDPAVPFVEAFCTLLARRFGDRQIMYVSDWVTGFSTWRTRNPDFPLWYANYNLGTSPTGGPAEVVRYRADVWQWTSKFKGGGIASGRPGQPSTDTGYDMNEVRNWAVLDRVCDLATGVDVPHVERPAPPSQIITAALAATAGGDMRLRIIADGSNRAAPERWLTNGLVRVRPTEHSLAWLERTGQIEAGQSIRSPEWLEPRELAGIPLVEA